MPVALDEYPVHQAALSMAEVATSDRNFYDRYYFNAHDRTGDIFVISGLGVYPNLGISDAFLTVRRGRRQWVLRCSGTMVEDRLRPRVGPYRIEVLEPLHKVRLVVDEVADLTWEGSFPCVDEPRHLLHSGSRVIVDGRRFAQVGTWSGILRVDGEDIDVSPDRWLGTRDRSWGIRPTGEAEPAGQPGLAAPGFWWLYVPLRFEEFAIIVIVQESPDGYRTLNAASRVFPDGRVEQLGWPRAEITYRSGTRDPVRATLHMSRRDGTPVDVDVETLGSIALHVGTGYGGDPEWTHGQWKGEGWAEQATYDLDSPEIAARMPWGVIDHVARASCDGLEGWGLFEHASIGRHDPSGFEDFASVAP